VGGGEGQEGEQEGKDGGVGAEKAKREQKEADKRARDVEDRQKVLHVLTMYPNGETTKVIGEETGIGNRAVGVLLGLLKELQVVCTMVRKPCGRNPVMSYKGWRLWRGGGKGAGAPGPATRRR